MDEEAEDLWTVGTAKLSIGCLEAMESIFKSYVNEDGLPIFSGGNEPNFYPKKKIPFWKNRMIYGDGTPGLVHYTDKRRLINVREYFDFDSTKLPGVPFQMLS